MEAGRVLTLLVLAAWVLLGPVAMAFDACGGMCDGLCVAPYAIASELPNETMLESVRALALPARPALPGTLGRVLEPPPKSLQLAA